MKNIKFVEKTIATAVGMMLTTGSVTGKKSRDYVLKTSSESNVLQLDEQRIQKEVIKVLDKLNIKDSEEYIKNYQILYSYIWKEAYYNMNNAEEKSERHIR